MFHAEEKVSRTFPSISMIAKQAVTIIDAEVEQVSVEITVDP